MSDAVIEVWDEQVTPIRRILIGQTDINSEDHGIKIWDDAGIEIANFSSAIPTIAGWNLNANKLIGTDIELNQQGWIEVGSGMGVVEIDATDVSYRLWVGDVSSVTAPFRVSKTGALTATDATITGTVTATAGNLGGWTVAATTLSNNDITLDSAGKLNIGTGNDIAILDSQDATYRLWVGNSIAANASFRVTKGGKLFATNIDVNNGIMSGRINMDLGEFITLDSGGATDFLLTGKGVGVYDLRIMAGGGDETAPFWLDSAGQLHAELGRIGGFDISDTTLSRNGITLDSAGAVKIDPTAKFQLDAIWNTNATSLKMIEFTGTNNDDTTFVRGNVTLTNGKVIVSDHFEASGGRTRYVSLFVLPGYTVNATGNDDRTHLFNGPNADPHWWRRRGEQWAWTNAGEDQDATHKGELVTYFKVPVDRLANSMVKIVGRFIKITGSTESITIKVWADSVGEGDIENGKSLVNGGSVVTNIGSTYKDVTLLSYNDVFGNIVAGDVVQIAFTVDSGLTDGDELRIQSIWAEYTAEH